MNSRRSARGRKQPRDTSIESVRNAAATNVALEAIRGFQSPDCVSACLAGKLLFVLGTWRAASLLSSSVLAERYYRFCRTPKRTAIRIASVRILLPDITMPPSNSVGSRVGLHDDSHIVSAGRVSHFVEVPSGATVHAASRMESNRDALMTGMLTEILCAI